MANGQNTPQILASEFRNADALLPPLLLLVALQFALHSDQSPSKIAVVKQPQSEAAADATSPQLVAMLSQLISLQRGLQLAMFSLHKSLQKGLQQLIHAPWLVGHASQLRQ